MQLYDLPLDQLQTYKPNKTAPHDFADFWASSLHELAKEKAKPELTPESYPADGVKVFRLKYRSFGKAEIEDGTPFPTEKDRIRPS